MKVKARTWGHSHSSNPHSSQSNLTWNFSIWLWGDVNMHILLVATQQRQVCSWDLSRVSDRVSHYSSSLLDCWLNSVCFCFFSQIFPVTWTWELSNALSKAPFVCWQQPAVGVIARVSTIWCTVDNDTVCSSADWPDLVRNFNLSPLPHGINF